MRVETVWHTPEREWPSVSGAVLRGDIASHQPTELVDDDRVVPVPQTLVEFHRRTGDLSVVLVGVDSRDVHEGQILRSRPRWACYSTVRIKRPTPGIPVGATGTIVEVYGTAYEVEVSDSEGRNLFLGPIEDDCLELVQEWQP